VAVFKGFVGNRKVGEFLYHMFSDKKLVNSVKERGMSGYDVKLSGQAPYLPWAKIKGTYYHWDTTTILNQGLGVCDWTWSHSR
jgi:hypothetical protein